MDGRWENEDDDEDDNRDPIAPINCPPETGGTSAAEGVDSHRYRNRLNYTAHRLRRKAQIFSDFN